MSKLIILVKATLLSVLDSLSSSSSVNSKKKRFSSIGILAFIGGLTLYYSFMINSQFASVLAPLNLMHVQLGLMMAITSIMTLFFSVGMVQNTMFEFKDYEMIMSLPVSTKIVIMSRFIVIYFSNIIFTVIIMLPAFIVYLTNTYVNSTFVLSFILTALVIPFIPIIIATILGTFIAFCTSRFKATKHIGTVLLFIIFIGIILLSYSYSSNLKNFGEIGAVLLDSINQIYPLAGLYVSGVCYGDLLSLLAFIGIGVALFAIYVAIMSKYFIPLYESVNKKPTSAKYKMTAQKSNSPISSLIKKELTIYFSSQPYVFNTLFGMVMLAIAVVAAVVYKNMVFDIIAEINLPIQSVFALAPVFIGMLVSLSCTTAYSVSYEGKSLWVIKTCPIDIKSIFLSKLAVTWIITFPITIISAVVLAIAFGFTLDVFLLFLITPIVISVFSSLFGMVINLNYPNIDWTNEAVIVKNSASAMFYVFIQMGISFASVMFSVLVMSLGIMPAPVITIIITTLYLIGSIVCYKIMSTKGVEQFKDLG